MYFGDIQQVRGTVHINKSWCKGCGFCVEYCPKDVLVMSDEYNAKGYHPPLVKSQDDCHHCRLCEIICPEFTIYVTPANEEKQGE